MGGVAFCLAHRPRVAEAIHHISYAQHCLFPAMPSIYGIESLLAGFGRRCLDLVIPWGRYSICGQNISDVDQKTEC